jgi:ubiquinol-cytochrome c reductase cytochrome b subunit
VVFGRARRRGPAARTANWADERLAGAGLVRKTLNKVFPDHWSFMLGEIALYSFVVLLLTGTFLALFFTPSSEEIRYHGSYLPLDGISMSKAYASTLDLSFDVRGGLIMRQLHHWAALLFMAAIVVHMLRIFFTGAFRKPRELNWMVGFVLFWMGFLEGFAGYSLPDDGLSGTGLRIADSIVLSIPLAGTWISYAMFGGSFPGDVIMERLYIVHVFLVPGLILALIALHLALVVKLKHTQWAGPGRTEHNVVGTRMVPNFAMRSSGLFMIVFAVLALLAGLVQINPVWLWGPYQASVVTTNAQPDWYVMFLEGALRLMPPWELRFGWDDHHYTVSPVFWPTVVLPGLLFLVGFTYPFVERLRARDRDWHNLLDRPRDRPDRTGLGAMAVTFYVVLLLAGADDTIAQVFHLSLDAVVWAGRILLLVLPPLAFSVTRRLCLWAQQQDRTRLREGIETGIIVRLPDGEYEELHQPLGDRLEYGGAAVPKRANQLGVLRRAVKGFYFPVEFPVEPPEEDPDGARDQRTVLDRERAGRS